MFPLQLFNWPSLQVGKDTLFAIPGFQDVGFFSDPGKPRVQFIVLLGDKVYKKNLDISIVMHDFKEFEEQNSILSS